MPQYPGSTQTLGLVYYFFVFALAGLTFFGLRDSMTVVEFWPGGGWYTEILAPTLRGSGLGSGRTVVDRRFTAVLARIPGLAGCAPSGAHAYPSGQ